MELLLMIKFNSFKCLLLLATLFPSGLMLPAEASTPSVDKVLTIQRYVLNGHTVTIEDGNRCGVTPRVSPEQPGVLERYVETIDDNEAISLLSFTKEWGEGYELYLVVPNSITGCYGSDMERVYQMVLEDGSTIILDTDIVEWLRQRKEESERLLREMQENK